MKLKNKKVYILMLLLFVLLSGVSEAYAQAARQKDSTVVAVNELTDVKGQEWAFMAVQELVEKYDVLEGYPDTTFRGTKPSTRFELAAAIYDLATYFTDEISLDREDLSKLAKLLDEFSTEIKTLQGRVDKLETSVSDLNTKYGDLDTKVIDLGMSVADLDTRATTLEGTVKEHTNLLDEYGKRLAYSERRKGFILERLIKGVVVDVRDLSRGLVATVSAPFSKTISTAIDK